MRCNAGNTTVVRNWARVNEKWPRDLVPGRGSGEDNSGLAVGHNYSSNIANAEIMRYVVQESEHNTMVRAKERNKIVIEPRIAMPHAPP